MTTAPLHPAEIFHLLHGNWQLNRSIPGHATMRGTARVTPLAHDTASYSEAITAHTAAGATLTATAAYLFDSHPAGLDVRFHRTGALFHTLRFDPTPDGSLIAHATHYCAADLYCSTYRLISPDHLEIEHRVTGPRKHYISHTTLRRP